MFISRGEVTVVVLAIRSAHQTHREQQPLAESRAAEPCSTPPLPPSLHVAGGEGVQEDLVFCTVSGCSILLHTLKTNPAVLKAVPVSECDWSLKGSSSPFAKALGARRLIICFSNTSGKSTVS